MRALGRSGGGPIVALAQLRLYGLGVGHFGIGKGNLCVNIYHVGEKKRCNPWRMGKEFAKCRAREGSVVVV